MKGFAVIDLKPFEGSVTYIVPFDFSILKIGKKKKTWSKFILVYFLSEKKQKWGKISKKEGKENNN